MNKIKINTEIIKLDAFLKWAGIVSSGSEAKIYIQDGLVKVNSEIWSAESENGEKIEEGSEVEIIRINGVKAILKKVSTIKFVLEKFSFLRFSFVNSSSFEGSNFFMVGKNFSSSKPVG